MTSRLRCVRCQDVIGAYEPVVAVQDGLVRETSAAAEPWLLRGDGEHYHRACYTLAMGNEPA